MVSMGQQKAPAYQGPGSQPIGANLYSGAGGTAPGMPGGMAGGMGTQFGAGGGAGQFGAGGGT